MQIIKILLFTLSTILFMSCSTSHKTIYIAPEKRPCTGVGKMDCMLIKTDKGQENWQFFYNQIEGFDYEEGYEYELLIKETKIDNPPADASSIKYTLVKVVMKRKQNKSYNHNQYEH